MVTHINGKDLSGLTHQEALGIVRGSASTMDLTLKREAGRHPASGRVHHIPIQTVPPRPLSPTPDAIKQTPFIAGFKAGHRQPGGRPWASSSASASSSALPHRPLGSLPRPYHGDKNIYWVKGQPMTQEEAEEYVEKEKERLSITHQAYRTQPIIHPSIKLKKDLPTGCYLRYYPEYSVKVTPIAPGNVTEGESRHKLADNVNAAAGLDHYEPVHDEHGLLPMHSSADGSKQVVHNLYNTPMHLYSNDSFQKAYRDQIGSNTNLKPSGPPATYDPKKSPTYQAVLEEEWNEVHRGKESESRIENLQHHYNVHTTAPRSKQHTFAAEYSHGVSYRTEPQFPTRDGRSAWEH